MLITTGTFDCPHMGHATFLAKCARIDEVVVGVLSDDFVESYKGERPIYSQSERFTQIRQLGYLAYGCSDQATFIRRHRPQYVAVGSDWARKDYYAQLGLTADDFDEMGIALVYIPYTPGISTTDLKVRLADADNR